MKKGGEGVKILVIEDNPVERKKIVSHLEKVLLYKIYSANNGNEALKMAEKIRPKIIIMDLGLPDISGYNICKTIKMDKELYGENRIIILTGKTNQADVNRGFKNGANDYIKKPYDITELMMRIKNAEDYFQTDSVVIYKDIEIDYEKMIVKKGDIEIELSKTEFELLKFIMEKRGYILSRSKIYSEIWGKVFEEGERAVDLYIGRLRKKIEGLQIKTVPGYGYKLEK